jgi:hypothetical protein
MTAGQTLPRTTHPEETMTYSPDQNDVAGRETSAPHVPTMGGFEDPAVSDRHRATIGQHETKPVRSSSGRRTFEVTRRHAPVIHHLTGGRMAADRESVRVSSLDLISQADAIMSDHADECDGCESCGTHDEACTDEGCAPTCEHRPIRLLGTDGTSRAFGQMLRTGRSDDPYGVAVHHGQIGDVLTSHLTPRQRANITDRYRNQDTDPVRGSKLSWPMRESVRIGSQRYRKGEQPESEPVTMVRSEWTVRTVTALPSWADSTARVHVGNVTMDRPVTVHEARADARKLTTDAVARVTSGQTSTDTAVYAPLAHVDEISAMWTHLAPGEAVSADVAGHALTLSGLRTSQRPLQRHVVESPYA